MRIVFHESIFGLLIVTLLASTMLHRTAPAAEPENSSIEPTWKHRYDHGVLVEGLRRNNIQVVEGTAESSQVCKTIPSKEEVAKFVYQEVLAALPTFGASKEVEYLMPGMAIDPQAIKIWRDVAIDFPSRQNRQTTIRIRGGYWIGSDRNNRFEQWKRTSTHLDCGEPLKKEVLGLLREEMVSFSDFLRRNQSVPRTQ